MTTKEQINDLISLQKTLSAFKVNAVTFTGRDTDKVFEMMDEIIIDSIGQLKIRFYDENTGPVIVTI